MYRLFSSGYFQAGLLLAGVVVVMAGAILAQAVQRGFRDHNTQLQECQRMSNHDSPTPQSEDQWRDKLTPQQYFVLRQKGTERAFTGELWNNKQDGHYHCAGCGQPLFHSDAKFDSGTGWPSFHQPVDVESVATKDDSSFFMRRTEVVCSRCEGHLGHVFPDGPAPTGMRFCINSAALTFNHSNPPESQPGS